MISYRYVVSDKRGLHASNAATICRAASGYASAITLESAKRKIDCKNLFAITSLDVSQGDSLTLTVEGPDEGAAAGYLNGLLRTVL
jgi:phosphocarrier protein